jgi:preprotein translocase subunit Sec61beta
MDSNMTTVDKSKPLKASSGLLRSYFDELRKWAAKLATGYAMAAGALIGGVLAVFSAAGVGVVALFHFVEFRYGTDMAYGTIGGGLLAIGVILLLFGWAMLRRRVPAIPRPRRQMQAGKRMIAGPMTIRLLARLRETEAVRADAATQVLIGAAAAVLVGWLVASRLQSPSHRRQAPR